MVKSIVNRKENYFQLVMVGIELAHKVFGLLDCHPELSKDSHALKANECAIKWNELFIQTFVSKKGGK